MDAFKDALKKLEDLRDNSIVTPEEFADRKKALVDQFIGVSPMKQIGMAGSGAMVVAPPGFVNPNVVVNTEYLKLRGLPYGCTDVDVIGFFDGFGLDLTDGIRFQLNAEGRSSGIAFVKLNSIEEARKALLSKNHHYVGNRYIEIFPSSVNEMMEKTHTRDAPTWIRMRGLPFDATTLDIVNFYEGFNVDESRVHIMMGVGGGPNFKGGGTQLRPTGEAYVQFADETEAHNALSKDRQIIGSRYVELFLATQEECDQAFARQRRIDRMILSRAGESAGGYGGGGMGGYGGRSAGMGGIPGGPHSGLATMAGAAYGRYEGGLGMTTTGYTATGEGANAIGAYDGEMSRYAPYRPAMSAATAAVFRGKGGMPQNMAGFGAATSSMGTRDPFYVLRCRGLPFISTEYDLREFFGGINLLSVHLVRDASERLTGEAFVIVGTKEEQDIALTRHRQLLGHRYIEVFRSTLSELQLQVPQLRGGSSGGGGSSGLGGGGASGTGSGGGNLTTHVTATLSSQAMMNPTMMGMTSTSTSHPTTAAAAAAAAAVAAQQQAAMMAQHQQRMMANSWETKR